MKLKIFLAVMFVGIQILIYQNCGKSIQTSGVNQELSVDSVDEVLVSKTSDLVLWQDTEIVRLSIVKPADSSENPSETLKLVFPLSKTDLGRIANPIFADYLTFVPKIFVIPIDGKLTSYFYMLSDDQNRILSVAVLDKTVQLLWEISLLKTSNGEEFKAGVVGKKGNLDTLVIGTTEIRDIYSVHPSVAAVVIAPTPKPVIGVPPAPTPKPVIGVPPAPTPKPVIGVPPAPTPKPVIGVPPAPTPKPVIGVPPAPTPKPVIGLPPAPTPKPVIGVPPAPTPKPVIGVPPVPTPKPVIGVPSVPTPKPPTPVPSTGSTSTNTGNNPGNIHAPGYTTSPTAPSAAPSVAPSRSPSTGSASTNTGNNPGNIHAPGYTTSPTTSPSSGSTGGPGRSPSGPSTSPSSGSTGGPGRSPSGPSTSPSSSGTSGNTGHTGPQ